MGGGIDLRVSRYFFVAGCWDNGRMTGTTFDCHLCGHIHDKRDELLAVPNVCGWCGEPGVYDTPHPSDIPAPLHEPSDEEIAEARAEAMRQLERHALPEDEPGAWIRRAIRESS